MNKNPKEITNQSSNDFSEGLKFYNSNDYSNAQKKFSQVFKADPQNYDACLYLGLSYLHLDDYLKAENLFNYIVYYNPDYETVYYYLGVTLIKLKKYDSAIENLLYASDIEPEKYSIYFNLGLAYHYKGDYNSAVKVLNQAIELNPKSSEAYYLLGLIYYNSNFLKYAKTVFKNTLLTDTENKYTTNSLKFLEIIKGKLPPETYQPSPAKKLSLYGYLGGNYDNNVNLTPLSYPKPFVNSDVYYLLGISGTYFPDSSFNISGSLYNYMYSKNTELNYQNLGLGGGGRLPINKFLTLSLDYNYYISYMDKKSYSNSSNIQPRIQVTETDNLYTFLGYEYNLSQYPDSNNKYLDGYYYKYSLEQYCYISKKTGYLKFAFKAGTQDLNDMSGQQYTYSYYRWNTVTSTTDIVDVYTDYFYSYSYYDQEIAAELYMPVLKGLNVLLSLSHERHTYLKEDLWNKAPAEFWYLQGTDWYKYENSQWVFVGAQGPQTGRTKKRIDTLQLLTLSIIKGLSGNLSISLNYYYTVSNSNIGIRDYYDYNYNHQVASAILQYTF